MDRRSGLFDPELEGMPPAERSAFKAERLRRLARYAYERSPAMRQKLDAARVPPDTLRAVEDLSCLSVTRKEDLVAAQKAVPPFGGFLAVPPSALGRIHVSPGPIFVPRAPDPEERRARARVLYACGFRAGDRVQNCFAYHLTPAGLGFDEGLQELGCVVIPAGPGNTELQVVVLARLQVQGYVGTPSFLKLLAEKAEEVGLDARRDLRLEVAFCGAEPLSEALREELEGRLGMLVRQAYGTADTGLLAHECPAAEGMHILDEAIVEVLDPDTEKPLPPGEVGHVVASVLDRTKPVIRFGTGDLSTLDDTPCPCGRTAPRLGPIRGRIGEIVKVRGMFLHPKEAEEVLARFPQIKRFQIVVSKEEDRDEMTFVIERGEDAGTLPSADALAGLIRDRLKLRARIRWVAPGTLPEHAPRLLDSR